MAMATYTMQIPWAGSMAASLKVVNARIMEAIEEFAKANKLQKKDLCVNYMWREKDGSLSYRIMQRVSGYGNIKQ